MKLNDIKDLLATVSKLDLSEVSIETAEIKLSVKKSSKECEPASGEEVVIPVEKAEEAKPKAEPQVDNKIIVDDPNIVIVESPIVGTVYLAPAPGEAPFVEVGTKVKKGQSLCIIEAMKLMNELRSEYDGTIIEIFARNEQPVQFGQPLMLIRK